MDHPAPRHRRYARGTDGLNVRATTTGAGRAAAGAALRPGGHGARWRAPPRPGLPAYLETINPDNVDLYHRAGWEVTASMTIDALSVWVMRHPAGMADT
jgi:hypothetical protein